MRRLLLKRGVQAIFVLIAVSLLSFILIYLSGDPVRTLVPLDATREDMDNIRAQFGLDRPMYIQYVTFIKQALKGDLGDSLRYRQESLRLVLQRLPATLLLVVSTLVIALCVSIPLGVVTATHRGRAFDHMATVFSLSGVSVPAFWIGIMLILVFADHFRIFPPSGKGGLMYLILPAVTNSVNVIGLITRLTRSTMLDELGKGYIRASRAKGMPRRVIYYKHALKNSLIPLVTVTGLQFGVLLGGSIIVETVFAWPGMGWLLFNAISMRDLPLIRASVLVISLFFVVINLLIDVIYTVVDPRIRYG